ncbi:MAG: 50S ribosomal protein L25 [Actinomycetota bacterium]
METILEAEHRTETGKGAGRRLRAGGRVPGVLYGHGMDPTPLSVSAKDLVHLFHASHGASMLIDLQVDGATHLAIPREVQRDLIHSVYVHVDFLAVRRDEKVKMTVEVRDVGEAAGVKEGGVLERHLREVEIECLPGDVPEALEADVTPLDIGDMLRVGDIVPPAGVTILTDLDTPIVSVITPAAMRTEADLSVPGEAPAPEAEEAPAEAAPAVEEAPAADEAPAEG